MITGQLELGFGSERVNRPATPRQRRLGRAQWWFERMRQVVDRAIDWPAAPVARPEQTWLPGSYRQVGSVGPVRAEPVNAPTDEHQVCA